MTRLSADTILAYIAQLQPETGLFPAIRRNEALAYRRPDTNVFFTAITAFTLQTIRPLVAIESQRLIDQISRRATVAYPLFENKDGLATYNFWPTRPSRHFPNGRLFHRFEHFRIPDDIDDTAMVYLTTRPSRTQQRWLADKVSQHANGNGHHRVKNTYPEYRDLKAYSTWFGKKMGVDFDACALSNLLYCLFQYQIPRDQHIIDSLTYVRSVVESGRYVSAPFQCAPHYARPSLILYHVARLLTAFDIPELASIRPRLVVDGHRMLATTQNRVEQMMIATALLRLGETSLPLATDGVETAISGFHFFIAGMLTAYEQPWLRRFAHLPIVHMRWQCEAHSWALVAEYLAVSQAKSLSY